MPAVPQRCACGAREGAAAAGSGAAGSNLELREGFAARLRTPCVVMLLGGLHGLAQTARMPVAAVAGGCDGARYEVPQRKGTLFNAGLRSRWMMVQQRRTARIETDLQVSGMMLWRRVVQMEAGHAMDGHARDARDF